MTKKGKTYLLLTIVLGIWGAIGYQIFSKLNPDDTPALAVNSEVNFSPKQTIEKDTFSINSEHRDPFLGKPYLQKKTSKIKHVSSSKKVSVVFPSIVYKGVISKSDNSSQDIYIIAINGTQQLFKVGKTIDEIKLLKGSKKSISIQYKGAQKTILVAK
ncbi:hypothetical protein [Kordia zhangzhouensis]|uniref:hypothetical protein n=1 Tax=Kordia zhangzhouensis TaxID=1620405 RepID=UPI0006294E6D|nr:hypothetical protein [Kordia zhangzhouensis]